jgi:DNA (cytosine-5)-methyltransferase 1
MEKQMRYLSICSGIEAATVAWKPIGWQAVAFAEIDKFPSAVLAHHYPETRNFGDFTQIKIEDIGPIDLLVGGTPYQDFSIAGLRAGVAGARGNLTLEFLRLAQRLRPRWLVWENVPGVYSSTSNDAPDHSNDGDGRWKDDANESHAFACFLAGLQELGYGFAYRTLDAQFFGVPQRRRRVFVIGHFGDWRHAAAVLFERQSLSGYPAPRRETREDLAPILSARTHGGGGLGTDFDCDGGLIAGTLSPGTHPGGYNGQDAYSNQLICFGGNNTARPKGVRRLTPRECERLQGFPDDYTKISGKTADGPRYKALGNSMAVPVMRWIGERISVVESISERPKK